MADSAEYRQVIEILSRHNYHRSFRTLAGANNMGKRESDKIGKAIGSAITAAIVIGVVFWSIGYLTLDSSLSFLDAKTAGSVASSHEFAYSIRRAEQIWRKRPAGDRWRGDEGLYHRGESGG